MAPIISNFSVSSSTIISGQQATLSWVLSGGAPATLTIDNSVGSVLGSLSVLVSPSTTTTYTLKASNVNGIATKQVTVTVNILAPVINTFSASSTAITTGQSSTLSWSLAGGVPTVLTIDNGIGSVLGTTLKSVSPATTTTYTLTARNLTGFVTKQITVMVVSLPPQITAFTANNQTITGGQTVTLNWALSGGGPVELALDSGIGSVLNSTAIILTPASTTIYTLTAKNPAGTVTKQVAVTVIPLGDGEDTVTPEDIVQTYTKYYPSQYYEYDSRGITTINVPFNGKIVATIRYGKDDNGALVDEISYLHLNYLGSPVIITNETADTAEVIKRDAWGGILSDSLKNATSTSTSFGFTGHRYDAYSDLTYAHARYYSSMNKVFLSEDPFVLTGFSSDQFLLNPQSQNSYSYAINNSVNYFDPTGLSWSNDFGSWVYDCPIWDGWLGKHWYVPGIVGTAPLVVYGAVAAGTSATAVAAYNTTVAGLAYAGDKIYNAGLSTFNYVAGNPQVLQNTINAGAGGTANVVSLSISDNINGTKSTSAAKVLNFVSGSLTGYTGNSQYALPLSSTIAFGNSLGTDYFNNQPLSLGNATYSVGVNYVSNKVTSQIPNTRGAYATSFNTLITSSRTQTAVTKETVGLTVGTIFEGVKSWVSKLIGGR